MDDTSHVFLIKDKIRCIQKKIMDQLAADLNNALNDDNMLTSSISNVTMASSHPLKSRRRKKRPTHPEQQQQQKMDASDSTTPENSRPHLSHRHGPDSIVSDGDEAAMPSSNFSSARSIRSSTRSLARNSIVIIGRGLRIGFHVAQRTSSTPSSSFQKTPHSIDVLSLHVLGDPIDSLLQCQTP